MHNILTSRKTLSLRDTNINSTTRRKKMYDIPKSKSHKKSKLNVTRIGP